MANNKGDGIAFATPRSSTWIVLNCILFVIVLDFCCVSIGDLTRDCLVFLKDRQVSRFGCFVFEFWVLRFRDLGASFSSFGCFVFEIGCFVFEIWVLRFRDLGASFSRFGCFVLRSSFSSASFSKLPFVLRSSFLKLPFISPIYCMEYVWTSSLWIGIFQRATQGARILYTERG